MRHSVNYCVITIAKSTTSNISIRMNSDLKAAAEALYEELSMNLSTAFTIFVRQSLRERGIPFKITEKTPNNETVSAMLEAERIAKKEHIPHKCTSHLYRTYSLIQACI